MKDIYGKWIEAIVPWLLDHGLKIIIIAISAWLLNKIISRIIIKAVRIAVVPDDNMSEEAEKKREDTLIRIFKGALRIGLLLMAILMILQEIGLEIGPILAGCRNSRVGSSVWRTNI